MGDIDPGGVANLNGTCDLGPVSTVRAYSLWAGLCPEKLVKLRSPDIAEV